MRGVLSVSQKKKRVAMVDAGGYTSDRRSREAGISYTRVPERMGLHVTRCIPQNPIAYTRKPLVRMEEVVFGCASTPTHSSQ